MKTVRLRFLCVLVMISALLTCGLNVSAQSTRVVNAQESKAPRGKSAQRSGRVATTTAPLARAASQKGPSPSANQSKHGGKESPSDKERATTTAARSRSSDTTPSASVDATTIIAELIRSDTKTTKPAAALVVRLALGGPMSDRSQPMRFFGRQRRALSDLRDLLTRLGDDASVSTVVVELSALSIGSATAQEIRHGLEQLHRKGKTTVALLNDDSQTAYAIALACNEIVMPPSNALMLMGARVDGYFFRSLLAKLGARADIIHIGEYKSYGEMYTEDDFTTPARQNMQAIVDDVYRQLVETIAHGRGLTTATVAALIDRGPLTAQEALEAKLIDRIAYGDDVIESFRRAGRKVISADDYSDAKQSRESDISLAEILTLLSGGKPAPRETKFPQVAVVYALGPILPGSSDALDLSASEEITAEDYLKILTEIEKDASIKGVILRVNSPGGSAFASDLLFRRLVELGKKKPLITSMGDVAASGGYYLAMAGKKIIANPLSVTGSIGVVGGKLDLAGTYAKIGINKSTVARGQFAKLFSETGGFSPQERAIVEKLMRQTYDEFVAKAAQQRSMTTETLERLAQGRVYTGAQAYEVGLVDTLGSFDVAVAEMKRLLGLQPEDKIQLVAYPKEVTLRDLILRAMGRSTQLAHVPLTPAALLPADTASWIANSGELIPPLAQALALGRLLLVERVALIIPFALEVK